jgi:hypothetical protein
MKHVLQDMKETALFVKPEEEDDGGGLYRYFLTVRIGSSYTDRVG